MSDAFLNIWSKNFQLALISVEGTVNVFNEFEDIWWLNGKRRIFQCLLWMAKFVMAFGWKAFCPANDVECQLGLGVVGYIKTSNHMHFEVC